MIPYRFEFETDEQYQARVAQELQPANANSSANTAPKSKLALFLPWWVLIPLGLAVLAFAFQHYRRGLIKKRLAEYQAKQKRSPRRVRTVRKTPVFKDKEIAELEDQPHNPEKDESTPSNL